MTEEQLIFDAGAAAKKACDLCQRIWKRPALIRADTTELVAVSRSLACLALELENSARGCAAPEPCHD